MLVKPCIKLCHNIIINEKNDICIGELPGSALIIRAAPEWAKCLVQKLDGKRTLSRIKKEMQIMHPGIDEASIDKFICKLSSEKLLEDNSAMPDSLSHRESERYDRQMLQFAVTDRDNQPSFVYQERLKSATVAILGMGGWGTWCALQLALLGIGTIRIVDGDEVELTNINRQVLYNDADIGKKKVHAAAARLKEANPHVSIIPFDEFVSRDEERLAHLFQNVNLIILAWASLGYYRKDTVEEKVHAVASGQNIPIIELGGDPMDISVGPIFPNDGRHCTYDALKQQQISSYYSDNDDIRGLQKARMKQSFLNGDRTVNAWQSAPSLAAMSGLVSDQVVKLLTKYDEPCLIGKRFHFSLRDFSTYMESVFQYE